MDTNNLIGNLPLVTEFPSRKHWEDAVWQILITRISSVQSDTELKKILQFLISSRDRNSILYRALAGSRILSKIGSSEISRELWLSRSTISAIKKSLVEGEYKSSHKRGHIKKEFSPGGLSSPRKPKPRYRKTKFGPRRMWTKHGLL